MEKQYTIPRKWLYIYLSFECIGLVLVVRYTYWTTHHLPSNWIFIVSCILYKSLKFKTTRHRMHHGPPIKLQHSSIHIFKFSTVSVFLAMKNSWIKLQNKRICTNSDDCGFNFGSGKLIFLTNFICKIIHYNRLIAAGLMLILFE